MIAGAVACAIAPLSAEAMSVRQFLAKTRAVQMKGMLAMGTPEYRQLRAEMKMVTDAYRADIMAARRAGKKPHSCPPAPPKPGEKATRKRMNADLLLRDLRAIPPEKRDISVKAAFYGIMKRRYPCAATPSGRAPAAPKQR